MSEVPDLVEVRVSVPDVEEGERLASALVERKLAACIQRVGPIVSTYVWEGAVEHETEWLLLAKTTASGFDALRVAVQDLHTYDVPEILAVPITHALPAYAQWVHDYVEGQET